MIIPSARGPAKIHDKRAKKSLTPEVSQGA
jgi:hypothetical protein